MLKHASRNHHDCNHFSVCGSAALSTLPLAGSPCRVWLQKTFITPEVPPPAPGPRSAHMGLPASDTWCQWTQAACGFCVWLRALSGWGQSSSTLGQQRLCLTAESYRPVYVSHSLFPTCPWRDICVLVCGVTALGLQSMTWPSPARQGHECEPAGPWRSRGPPCT